MTKEFLVLTAPPGAEELDAVAALGAVGFHLGIFGRRASGPRCDLYRCRRLRFSLVRPRGAVPLGGVGGRCGAVWRLQVSTGVQRIEGLLHRNQLRDLSILVAHSVDVSKKAAKGTDTSDERELCTIADGQKNSATGN